MCGAKDRSSPTSSHPFVTIEGMSRIVFLVVAGGLLVAFKTADIVGFFPRRHWVHAAQRWLVIGTFLGGGLFAPDAIMCAVNRANEERAKQTQELIERITEDRQRRLEERMATTTTVLAND